MITVYAVDVSNMDAACYETLYSAASQERKERSDKSRKADHARCCLISEALLRYAVKRHLGTTEFTLAKNEHGKPRVQNCSDFHFNISHSGHWVVLACGETEVGIDVETIRKDHQKEKIARRFFTPEEQDYVFQEKAGEEERFFQIWTSKESYLKYLGTGLQKALHSFCVRSMENPNFFFQQLGDCAMTLCTEDLAYELDLLTPERLL